MTTTLNPTITITVSGPTGSGKSRVLALIADELRLCYGDDIIIDSPELASERRMNPKSYATWHKPRSGTLFKLNEINLPINTGRCIYREAATIINKLANAQENRVETEAETRKKIQAAITTDDLLDRPVPVHIQALMSKLGISFEEFRETSLQPVVDLVNWAMMTPQMPIDRAETKDSETPGIIIQPVTNIAPAGTHTDGGLGCDLSAMPTDGATPVPLSVSDKDNLLASIETRLTQEVRDLADALGRFSRNTQRLSHELPDTAHFGKSVTLFLSLGSLQLANALLQNRDKPLLLDDGIEYLRELGLSLNDFIREIELDGRKFLAIAFVNNSAD
ncbi:hypothetical protein E1K64_15860 [Salmonella enterica subsp. enterica serovar Poona]|nr:hypothetical protein [Salmonella enterica subsp. enterica serovar Poona]